ncbi:MAG: peptidase T [Flavobacteriales bacterium]|nr:peptidase T [Bacteroidota bacterium]MCB9241437.1 peptidase T [Flavobacteriales bacterium]
MAASFHLTDRFKQYVQIDTQADPESTSFPSTEKQKNLGKVLRDELMTLGASEVEMDEFGYVYATIPATTENNVPVLCFCSHMDTAPDCSGTNVKPIVHAKWDGSDIVLPDDPTQVISSKDHPYLSERIGDDIITASGNTLLGADDKAGVAIIMATAEYLLNNPSIPHGKIRILFTPDEEVGRGVEHVDMKKLGADFGYTLDGGERGSLEGDTFSADGVKIVIHGVSAHPGYAKDKLVNSLKIAGEYLDALPKGEWSPETTEDRQGYVHPVSMNGIAEKTTINFIIRDFVTANLKDHEDRLKTILDQVMSNHPKASAEFVVTEQYRNMRDMLDTVPHVEAYAAEAMKRAGIDVKEQLVRGGTDGSRLSFMGLPCPNIFTGEMAIHSKHEYVSVQDMEAACNTLVELVQVWEERSNS